MIGKPGRGGRLGKDGLKKQERDGGKEDPTEHRDVEACGEGGARRGGGSTESTRLGFSRGGGRGCWICRGEWRKEVEENVNMAGE